MAHVCGLNPKDSEGFVLQVFDHAMKYYLRVLVDTKASAAYNALDSKDDVFNITTIEELAEVGPTDLGDKLSSVLKGPDGKWHEDYLPSEESMRKKLPGHKQAISRYTEYNVLCLPHPDNSNVSCAVRPFARSILKALHMTTKGGSR